MKNKALSRDANTAQEPPFAPRGEGARGVHGGRYLVSATGDTLIRRCAPPSPRGEKGGALRYIIHTAFFFFLSSTVHAESTLAFKKEPLSTVHWFPYLLVLTLLLVALLMLAKKSKSISKHSSKNLIIEKIPINQKTQVYVLEYQGQRFLIADNQNALAIHPLAQEKPSI